MPSARPARGRPLVEEHGFGKPTQDGIRIGAEGGGLRLAIQAYDLPGETERRGRLADGPRIDDEDGGQLAKGLRLPASRTLDYQRAASPSANQPHRR